MCVCVCVCVLHIYYIFYSWKPPSPLIKGGRTFQKLSHLGGHQMFC